MRILPDVLWVPIPFPLFFPVPPRKGDDKSHCPEIHSGKPVQQLQLRTGTENVLEKVAQVGQ